MDRTVALGANSDESLGAMRKAAGQAAVRDAMAEVAEVLFVKHGFGAVTLEQIAEACDVSVRTILRYFPTKEHLALSLSYARLKSFKTGLAKHGGDTLSYWRKHVTSDIVRVAGDGGEMIRQHWKMTSGSDALRAHSASITHQYQELLANAFAEETGDAGVGPRLLAAVLVGGHLAATEHWLLSGKAFDPDVYLAIIDYASRTVLVHFPPKTDLAPVRRTNLGNAAGRRRTR
jgi:AcrR family transcriptional regulator